MIERRMGFSDRGAHSTRSGSVATRSVMRERMITGKIMGGKERG
jgi:hypothetical protein